VTVGGYHPEQYRQAAVEMQKAIDLVTAAREFRKSLGKGFKDKLTLCPDFSVSAGMLDLSARLAAVDFADLQTDKAVVKPFVSGKVLIACSEKEKRRFRDMLEDALQKSRAELSQLEKMLTPGFREKADPDLVAERTAQFEAVKTRVQTLEAEIAQN
jgi:valyl-tRNA synthetase